MAKSSEIRGTWKQRATGKIVACLQRLVGCLVRYEVLDENGAKARVDGGEVMIWAFWHNTLFSAPLVKHKMIGSAEASALASASKDGAVVESVVASYGVKTIRGSSSRRAVAALIAMKKALKRGEQIMVTPDGPRGPVNELQAGIIHLAQKSGAPIVPVKFTHSSSWRLKSWDRFHIPKPFSRVTVEITKPVKIPAELDAESFEQVRQEIQELLG